MKILQINNYNYLRGGSEKVYFDTIDILKANGHDIYYFSTHDDRNIDQNLIGVSVKVNHWSKRLRFYDCFTPIKDFIYNKRVALELDNFLKSQKIDIAHLHIYYGCLSNSIIKVLLKHNIPIVQSIHEFRLLCPAYTCLNSKNQICEKCATLPIKYPCVVNKCLKNSFFISLIAVLESSFRDYFFCNQQKFSAFIMVSKFIQMKHEQYFPVMKDKNFQIYNSIDLLKYKIHAVNPSKKKNYYLYFGRLSYEKGLVTLINAFSQLSDFQLIIVGDGPEKEPLITLVDSNNISNISFTGFLQGSKLFDLIANAKFVISPSEWYENNPISLIESLALGTPIIGSRIGGIPELVDDNINGFLFEPTNINSLIQCIRSSSKLSNNDYGLMCKATLLKAQLFCRDNYYNSLINVYKSVIG